MHFEGPLPAAWSGGFRQLQYLIIRQLDSMDSHTTIAPAAPALQAYMSGGTRVLPSDWAAGFPHLLRLALHGLAITGSIPIGWIAKGFPKLDAL